MELSKRSITHEEIKLKNTYLPVVNENERISKHEDVHFSLVYPIVNDEDP